MAVSRKEGEEWRGEGERGRRRRRERERERERKRKKEGEIAATHIWAELDLFFILREKPVTELICRAHYRKRIITGYSFILQTNKCRVTE